MKKTFVVSRFRAPGFHCWPGAPDDFAYLRNNHRHEFHVTVSVEVDDPNRQIEFIRFKTQLQLLFNSIGVSIGVDGPQFGARSCEMLADELCHKIRLLYNYHVSTIEVSEDGENGAICLWE